MLLLLTLPNHYFADLSVIYAFWIISSNGLIFSTIGKIATKPRNIEIFKVGHAVFFFLLRMKIIKVNCNMQYQYCNTNLRCEHCQHWLSVTLESGEFPFNPGFVVISHIEVCLP